jgi:membrane-associated phospholipid phosphatase
MTHTSLLVALLVLVFASMTLYFPLNRGRARYFFESPLDRYIPFIPQFIIPYLALVPFIVTGLIAALFTPVAPELYLALIIGVLSGSFTRYFVHSGIRQPEIRKRDFYNRLVHWLYVNDDRAHTFPSSHVLISITMSYYLAVAFPQFMFLIWTVGILIAGSTVFVKQHYIVDVLGGLAFATVAVYLTSSVISFVR